MDPATLILTALALVVAAVGLWCVRRAFAAHGARVKIGWAGRALALFGAAFAIWFPAELYGEVVMIAPTGSDDLEWLPRAIWHSFATMPLAVIPALVALRSLRAGGVLFLVATACQVFEAVARPFGVIFPDARTDAMAYVFSYGPWLVTAALLLAGRGGPTARRGVSGRYLTLGPAR